MQSGVKRLALSLDADDAVAFQDIQHLRFNHGNALHQRAGLAGLLGRLRRPFEVVQSGQQVRGQRLVGETPFLLNFTLGPFLVVLEVGARALGR